MLIGVECGATELRTTIGRATAIEDVRTSPAALCGAVATFVLAVTQPATDDANATSANPREIRPVASNHSFDMRDPP
jgi:hypothetical protein